MKPIIKIALKVIGNFLFVAILAIGALTGYFYITGKNVYKFYTVTSGSMEPTVKVGGVVLVIKTNYYKPGDIITFAPAEKDKLITHRILFKLYTEGIDKAPIYLTSGDANEDFDHWKIKDDQIQGKVFFTLPYVGYASNFLKSPKGFILLVIVPATIIVYEELRSLGWELSKSLKKFRKKKSEAQLVHNENARKGLPQVFAVVPILFAFLVVGYFSASYFFDREGSVGNEISTATSFGNETPSPTSPTQETPTPTPTPGPGDIVINEINWGGSNGDGLDEWIELRNVSSNTIDLTNWVVDNLGLGGPNADITIPSGTISPNGFFVISRKNKTDSRMNIDPDFIVVVSLENGGEQLILKNNLGTTIDTANGTGAWFTGSNSTPKKSMERINLPGDGTLSSNWQTATTHTNMDGSGSSDEFATPKAPNGL